jgi:hypothetical protein
MHAVYWAIVPEAYARLYVHPDDLVSHGVRLRPYDMVL